MLGALLQCQNIIILNFSVTRRSRSKPYSFSSMGSSSTFLFDPALSASMAFRIPSVISVHFSLGLSSEEYFLCSFYARGCYRIYNWYGIYGFWLHLWIGHIPWMSFLAIDNINPINGACYIPQDYSDPLFVALSVRCALTISDEEPSHKIFRLASKLPTVHGFTIALFPSASQYISQYCVIFIVVFLGFVGIRKIQSQKLNHRKSWKHHDGPCTMHHV